MLINPPTVLVLIQENVDVPECINPDWIVCRLIRIDLLIVHYRFQLVVTVGDRILKHDQLRGGQVESDLHWVSVVDF